MTQNDRIQTIAWLITLTLLSGTFFEGLIPREVYIVGGFLAVAMFTYVYLSYSGYFNLRDNPTKKLPCIEVIIVKPIKYYKCYNDAVANLKRNGVIWYESGKGYYIMYHSDNILESQTRFFRQPRV